ncbi:hypothetical protein EVAR_36324_1 [Eumeta japonica]|uniref:BESS domain-containing protein n=1 Tax=Eumeta variegata TaxID=151549 RepID=A0A4C1VIM8_EUMVA|nr:hypothetical protein EVAR_36324_1 [Eumeta japonica]
MLSAKNVRTEDETKPQPDLELPFQSPSQHPIRSSSQSVPSSSHAGPSSTPVYIRPNNPKKGSLDIDEAQNKIPQTLDTLNQVLKNKRNHTNEKNEDECELYAKLLAKRLRKYPESMQGTIMYQIDGLLLQNPYPVDRPSSAYSLHSSTTSSSENQVNVIEKTYWNATET